MFAKNISQERKDEIHADQKRSKEVKEAKQRYQSKMKEKKLSS